MCSIAADIRQTVHSFAKQRSALHCRTLQILQSCYTFRLGCRSAGLLCRNALASQLENQGGLFFQGCIFYSFTSHKYRSCSIPLWWNKYLCLLLPTVHVWHRLVERGWLWLTSAQTSWKAGDLEAVAVEQEKHWQLSQALKNRGGISKALWRQEEMASRCCQLLLTPAHQLKKKRVSMK